MNVTIKGIPFMTVSQAAEAIGITPGRLCQMLRDKQAAGIKAGPRAWLIPKTEVARLKKKPQTTGRPRVGTKPKKIAERG